MSIDLEAGGALVTAGLAANELDAHAKKSGANHPERMSCANCNAKLSGAFCQQCGQSSHVHRSLWHMFEEALHGVLHFDTKSWRTLPLLVARPGLLTRRYIDGQRVRYVSPLALFLFSVFLMFFAFSFVDDANKSDQSVANAKHEEVRAALAANLDAANKKVAEAAAAKKNVTADDVDAAASTEAMIEKQVAEAALSTFDQATRATDAVDAAASTSKVGGAPTGDIEVNTGSEKLDDALRHSFRNKELLFYKLKNTAYKFSFLLIPISLPFLWMMFFWRKGVRVYDHAVFSLYSLAFMSLLFVVVVSVGLIPGVKNVAGVLLLLPPVHMFLQLRETYSLGVFSTLWRTVALLCIVGTVFVIFMAVIAAMSMT
jgi:hypothetical protein